MIDQRQENIIPEDRESELFSFLATDSRVQIFYFSFHFFFYEFLSHFVRPPTITV